MTDLISPRVMEPIETPIGRVSIGTRDGREVFVDIYPSDIGRGFPPHESRKQS